MKNLKVKDLIEIAKEMGIKYAGLRKADLIEKIENKKADLKAKEEDHKEFLKKQEDLKKENFINERKFTKEFLDRINELKENDFIQYLKITEAETYSNFDKISMRIGKVGIEFNCTMDIEKSHILSTTGSNYSLEESKKYMKDMIFALEILEAILTGKAYYKPNINFKFEAEEETETETEEEKEVIAELTEKVWKVYTYGRQFIIQSGKEYKIFNTLKEAEREVKKLNMSYILSDKQEEKLKRELIKNNIEFYKEKMELSQNKENMKFWSKSFKDKIRYFKNLSEEKLMDYCEMEAINDFIDLKNKILKKATGKVLKVNVDINLNGQVETENEILIISTIIASGPVQRPHYRTLVKVRNK